MKNFILLVVVMSLAVVANAGETAKKANRKPAEATGNVVYSGPVTPDSTLGELTIEGDAADQIYANMKAISPPQGSSSGKLTGHNIVCTPKNPPALSHGHCEIDFDDVTTGVVHVWSPNN